MSAKLSATQFSRNSVYTARSPDKPKHLARVVYSSSEPVVVWRGGQAYTVGKDHKLVPVVEVAHSAATVISRIVKASPTKDTRRAYPLPGKQPRHGHGELVLCLQIKPRSI